MSTSQNGWPALESSSPLLYRWIVPIKGMQPVEFTLRNGSAGFILCWLVLRIAETIRPLNRKADDWGYAFRAIRGYSTTLSNHSSGTAVDIDSLDHGLGMGGTWLAKQVVLLHRLLAGVLLSGVVRWGGDYHGRKDEMHFELVEDLSVCERVARRLMKTPRGKRILAANPTQEKVILS